MDITQLVSTVAAVVGVALVGAMAVVPAVMAAPGRAEHRPAGQLPAAPPAPRRRHRRAAVDLAA